MEAGEGRPWREEQTWGPPRRCGLEAQPEAGVRDAASQVPPTHPQTPAAGLEGGLPDNEHPCRVEEMQNPRSDGGCVPGALRSPVWRAAGWAQRREALEGTSSEGPVMAADEPDLLKSLGQGLGCLEPPRACAALVPPPINSFHS